MAARKTFLKIKELGHINNNREKLRDYCKLKIDEILKYLSQHIMKEDGADYLDCIFNGIPDSGSLVSNKIKIIDIVLKTMRKENASLIHCSQVISKVCLELPRQPVTDLVRWSDDCVQSIVDDSDVNMIWRDVLPECLYHIVSHDSVNHCGTDMSGAEYKVQCVQTLCQCRWTQRQLLQLTAMFKDLQLSKNHHKQVVRKICSHINYISPEALPPLVHQLLKLCKLYNVEIVLAELGLYFNVYFYKKFKHIEQESEATLFLSENIDELDPYGPQERCVYTCIYHITQATEPELIRKHIKMWPKTQLLKTPFLVGVALAMSDKGADFTSVCLEAIKSAIEQHALDDLYNKEYAWIRSVMQSDVNVKTILDVLTNESADHQELTVFGLINLAFTLLSVSQSKQSAPTCWSQGSSILVTLCKKQQETAPQILSQLADKLCGDTMQRQYSRCFHALCKYSQLSIEKCTQVATILENCQPTSTEYESAAKVLDAVHPLLNFSMRTRDALVMVCRKGLYSRDPLQRCLSLSGFLTILRHIKLSSRSLSNSQGAASQRELISSCFTQLSLDFHATQQGVPVTSRVRNETLCLEVLSVLRRCLTQDAMVKTLLYNNIYKCVKYKPALHETALDFLYEHLCKYLPDQESGEALLLDECIRTNAITSVLIEPISKLLYVFAQFLQPGDVNLKDSPTLYDNQNTETGSAHLKSKLSKLFEKFTGSDFAVIDMEEHGLADLTPESKAKCLKVQQILQCYEVLIAHQIMQWNVNGENFAETVYRLFKAYNKLLDQTKTPTKSSKKINKTNLNETKDTAKSQKSQKSQKDKGKGPFKLPNMVKERAGPFKPLPCIWDMELCFRLLDLLHSEEVSWSSAKQRNLLLARKDFHRWALRNVMSVLNEPVDSSSVATTVVGIASLMYKRCICRFQTIYDSDDQIAEDCLNVFKSCLDLILSKNYSFKLNFALVKITGPEVVTATGSVAAMLQRTYDAFKAASGEEDVDGIDKIIAVLSRLITLFLEIPLESSDEMNRVIIKLEEHLKTCKQDCSWLIAPLLNASCRGNQEAQLLDELLTKLAIAMGLIREQDSSTKDEFESFPSVDAETGDAVLNQVCAHLDHRFKSVEYLMARAKDLSVALEYVAPTQQKKIDREVTEAYKSLIVQLRQLRKWTCVVVQLRCDVKEVGARVLTTCLRLYTLVATLVKQMPPALANTVRLEVLLKLFGKLLSAGNCLITYVQSYHPRESSNKVQRVYSLIPLLVREAEQVGKHVMLLSSKTKVNYQQYLPLGTARDFKIDSDMLIAAKQGCDSRDEETDEEMDEDDVPTVGLSPPRDPEKHVRKKRRIS